MRFNLSPSVPMGQFGSRTSRRWESHASKSAPETCSCVILRSKRSSEQRSLLPVFRHPRPALARYRQRRGQFDGERWISYDTSDGLVWNDCNTHANLSEADGTFWVGTSGGLSRFFLRRRQKRPAADADYLRASQRSACPEHGIRFLYSFPGASLYDPLLQPASGKFSLPNRHGSSPWIQTQTRRSASPNFLQDTIVRGSGRSRAGSVDPPGNPGVSNPACLVPFLAA